MASPLEAILTRAFSVPLDDGTVPAFLELSDGSSVDIETGGAAQIRQAAKMHYPIAERHTREADRLTSYVAERERSGDD